MKAITTTLLLIIVISILHSCYYDNEAYLYPETADIVNCTDTSFTYTVRISSLIGNYCYGSTCHNQVNNGRVNFTTFNAIFSLKEEIVCRVVEGETCNLGNKMPPSGNLTACDLEAFSRWEQNGYPQ